VVAAAARAVVRQPRQHPSTRAGHPIGQRLLTIVQVKVIIVGSDGGSECAGDEAFNYVRCGLAVDEGSRAVWHAVHRVLASIPQSTRAIAVPTLMRVPGTEEEVWT
jgi:hypothetical protein